MAYKYKRRYKGVRRMFKRSKRTFRRKRTYRRRSSTLHRRRYVRRRQHFRRKSQYKTVITRVFRSDVKEITPNGGKTVSHRNSLTFNPKKAFDQIIGNNMLTHYATMYDEFRCTKVTLKIWINARGVANDTTATGSAIPDIMVAYDPDASGRTFSGYQDFYLLGAKAHFMRPFKVKTLTLYPKLSPKMGVAIPAHANANPWMDCAQMFTDAYFPNSVQYIIRDMTGNKNDIECQYYYTYQFRELRNGQSYGITEDDVKIFENGCKRIIPANDSQNMGLHMEVNDNFEMLNFNNN